MMVFFIILGAIMRQLTWQNLLIFLYVVGGGAIFLFVLYLFLRMFNWGYYLIDADGITLYKKQKRVFGIKRSEITALGYLSFLKGILPLPQFGAGYLMVHNTSEESKGKQGMLEFASVYGIAMSPKQAKEVAMMLNLGLTN